MPAVTRRTAAAAAICGVLLCGCSDDQPVADRTGAVARPNTEATPVLDLRAAVGQSVEVLATVQRVLHANAFVVVDGQVGTTPVLVTTGTMPVGLDAGRPVRITGTVVDDPPGWDPVMDQYKAKGPIIEAADVSLR
jgi:hypothetical protein